MQAEFRAIVQSEYGAPKSIKDSEASIQEAILGPRLAFELEYGGHSSNEGWDSRGALGRY
jgi:hypothetical protein